MNKIKLAKLLEELKFRFFDYYFFRIIEKYLINLCNRENLNSREKKILHVKDLIAKWRSNGRKIYISNYYYDDNLKYYLKQNSSSDVFEFNFDMDFKSHDLNNFLIILNINDFSTKKNLKKITLLKKNYSNVLFLVYLYDNHHLISQSVLASKISDVVVIAHPDFNFLIQSYSPIVLGPIVAPVLNWNLSQVEELNLLIEKTDRRFDVGGIYNKYSKFSLRNECINFFANKNDRYKINFTGANGEKNFHAKNPFEMMNEWTQFKTSFIIPVSDDLPIRFFDALLTGSIPIVPHKLKFKVEALKCYEEISSEIYWYDESNINHIDIIVINAVKYFDESGVNGIRKRSNWARRFHTKEIVLGSIISRLNDI